MIRVTPGARARLSEILHDPTTGVKAARVLIDDYT